MPRLKGNEMFKKYFFNLKQDQATDVGGYGAPATQVPPPPAQQPANTTPAQAAGDSGDDNLDSYGYEKLKSEQTPPAQTQTADTQTKAQAVAPAAEPVAGYGKDPVVVPPPAAPAAPATEPIKLEYELDGTDLDKTEFEKVQKFALENKLPKEAAQAFVNQRKAEIAEYRSELVKIQNEQKQKIAEQKASWHSELVADPKFGGENFLHNLSRVDKVLTTLMPDTKKVLTERGSMLPPYVMRDLLTVYNSLYSTDELVGGNPPTPVTVVKEESPLDFYQ